MFRECCVNALLGALVVTFSPCAFFLKQQLTIDTDTSLADLASSLHMFSDITTTPHGE